MMEMSAKSKGDGESDAKFKDAAKSMTGARITELKAAHEHFGMLLTTIGALKAEEEDEEMKSEKQKAAAVGESVGAEVAKALGPVAEVLKGFAGRLDRMESTRGAARGEVDPAPVQKNATGLFTGLF